MEEKTLGEIPHKTAVGGYVVTVASLEVVCYGQHEGTNKVIFVHTPTMLSHILPYSFFLAVILLLLRW